MDAKRAMLAAGLAALALAGISGTAAAEPHGRVHGRWQGDIARFHERDWGVWRGGHWYHGSHGGRLGWWWIAGGLWYFYPVPVYPYPNPYEPPPVPPASELPPPTQYWYYCDEAKAYYPYVATCPGPWRKVPATPPGAR